MNVGSLFTGVGGFDLGFERAGMRIVFQCELDPWCRGILAQHWPDVPCYDDIRAVRVRKPAGRSAAHVLRPPANHRWGKAWAGLPHSLDLLCGGFPCQDLSVAGKRRGLAGERSGLFFEFARVADELVRPGGWIVIENVPGLLSSANGRDFAIVLRTLGDVGFHDLAWRVLDSRYFGVPQRRRRVFIVGRRTAGDGARQVLLEPESGGGNFAPGSQARARVAASLSRGSGSPGVSAPGRRQEDDANIVGYGFGERDDIASTLGGAHRGGGHDLKPDRAGAAVGPPGTRRDDDYALVAHTLRAEGFDASEDGTGRGTPLVAGTLQGRRGPGPEQAASNQLVSTPPDPDGMREAPRLPGRAHDPKDGGIDGNGKGGGTRTEAGAACLSGYPVFEVWRDGEALPPSRRSQPLEQRSRQRRHLVLVMSHGEALGRGLQITAQAEGLSDLRRDLYELQPLTGKDLLARLLERGWATERREAQDAWESVYGVTTTDPQPDGPRYSAMGNAVSVPVLEWVGRRIMEYENRRER